MDFLIFFGFPAAVAITLTVLLCRHQIARKKRISFGTVCLATLGAMVIDLGCAIGPDILSSQFWNYIWDNTYFPGWVFFLETGGLPLVICFVSSISVAAACQLRSRPRESAA